DGIRDFHVTGVQTCALPISARRTTPSSSSGEVHTHVLTPSGRLMPATLPRPSRSCERRSVTSPCDGAGGGPHPAGTAFHDDATRSDERRAGEGRERAGAPQG